MAKKKPQKKRKKARSPKPSSDLSLVLKEMRAGFKSTGDRMNRFEGQLNAFDRKMEAGFKRTDTRIDKLDHEMKAGFKRVDRLENEVKTGFKRVDGRIDKLDHEMKAGFKRVDRLESEVRAGFKRVDGRIDKLDHEVKAGFKRSDERMDKFDNSLNLVAAQVAENTSHIQDLKTSVNQIIEITKETKMLVEQQYSDNRATAEGHQLLNDRVDRVEKRLDRLERPKL